MSVPEEFEHNWTLMVAKFKLQDDRHIKEFESLLVSDTFLSSSPLRALRLSSRSLVLCIEEGNWSDLKKRSAKLG
ncbi:hypothetical protein V6N13_075273 [Hibiscus sabdariffa]